MMQAGITKSSSTDSVRIIVLWIIHKFKRVHNFTWRCKDDAATCVDGD